jgi:proteic killer suppression protein
LQISSFVKRGFAPFVDASGVDSRLSPAKSLLIAVIRCSYYVSRMIRSIKGAATRQFVESGKSIFSGLDSDLTRRRLSASNAARKLDDLSRLHSVGLHKLSGGRAGRWAISVNGPWRIVFRFDGGDAFDVEIVDYH